MFHPQERAREPQIVRAGNGVGFHGVENHQHRTPDLGSRFYNQQHEVSRAPYGNDLSRGNHHRVSSREARGGGGGVGNGGGPQMVEQHGRQEGRRSHRRDLMDSESGVARLRGGGGGGDGANPVYDLDRTPLEGSGGTKKLKTGEILLNATRLNGP